MKPVLQALQRLNKSVILTETFKICNTLVHCILAFSVLT